MTTIKDIAKHANVSISSVSKAFNNYKEISEATKQRIFESARILNFVPNKAAKELSLGKFPYLGLIVQHLTTDTSQDEHIFRMLSGVHSRASETGHELVLFTTDQIKQKNMTYVEFCRHHSLIGAIIHGLDKDCLFFEELLLSPIPCVLIDVAMDGLNTAFVSSDNIKASFDAIDYLYEHGHRNIAHILGSDSAEVTNQRRIGVLKAVEYYKLPQPVFIIGDFNEKTAYINTKKAISEYDFTAVFAASDLMVLSALKAIYESGLKPKKDIALIGFDGLYILEHTNPSISTIYQDFYAMGRVAVDTLLSISKKESFNKQNFVPYMLLKRDSV